MRWRCGSSWSYCIIINVESEVGKIRELVGQVSWTGLGGGRVGSGGSAGIVDRPGTDGADVMGETSYYPASSLMLLCPIHIQITVRVRTESPASR